MLFLFLVPISSLSRCFQASSSIPILHRYKPPMPEKVVRPPEAVCSVSSSGLEIVSKLWDILFWVCCVKSDSEIRRDIGQIVLPGLGRCPPTLASRHLKLYNLQLDIMKGRRNSERIGLYFVGITLRLGTRYFVLLVPSGTLGQSFMDLSLSIACFYRRHEKISNK